MACAMFLILFSEILDLESFAITKVILKLHLGNQQPVVLLDYDFLLVFHYNCVSLLYYIRDITTCL